LDTYEALFIIDSSLAAKDWAKVTNYISGVIGKYKGEVLAVSRWGERKLCYSIGPHKRGTYALMYFKMPRPAVNRLRHDLQLAEMIVRFIVLRFEGEAKELPPPEGF
jgi:small subunit ribosomal protein S6